MPLAKLVICDEVNVQFKGLDPDCLNACKEELSFHVPGYVHMANVRLGWWDGRIDLFKAGTGYTH